MIICFSSTGNTRYVAELLHRALGDQVTRITPRRLRAPLFINMDVTDNRIIWCFPVHAWGLPSTTEAVIREADIRCKPGTVHHMVCTCGDDIGHTDIFWRKAIRDRGWTDGTAHSVRMPNIYTFLPGFDTDPAGLAAEKLKAAPERVRKIAAAIAAGDSATTDVVRGSMAWVKSHVLRPLFTTLYTSPRMFGSIKSRCTGCGKCATLCAMANITIKNGRPKWGGHCTQCARCYHVCPAHAITYGIGGRDKGQYLCPEYSFES